LLIEAEHAALTERNTLSGKKQDSRQNRQLPNDVKKHTVKMTRLYTFSLLVLSTLLISEAVVSQNVLINILTQNSGVVKKGGVVFLEVTINNTDATAYIGVYKVRAKINVPSSIVSVAAKGHILPTGWTITENDGNTITLSNGKDMIAANDARTILIALNGDKPGGPSTISGQLLFSDGTAPGTAPGTIKGDLPGDNTSTTTCKVTTR
jgi:hypothetical protein